MSSARHCVGCLLELWCLLLLLQTQQPPEADILLLLLLLLHRHHPQILYPSISRNLRISEHLAGKQYIKFRSMLTLPPVRVDTFMCPSISCKLRTSEQPCHKTSAEEGSKATGERGGGGTSHGRLMQIVFARVLGRACTHSLKIMLRWRELKDLDPR